MCNSPSFSMRICLVRRMMGCMSSLMTSFPKWRRLWHLFYHTAAHVRLWSHCAKPNAGLSSQFLKNFVHTPQKSSQYKSWKKRFVFNPVLGRAQLRFVWKRIHSKLRQKFSVKMNKSYSCQQCYGSVLGDKEGHKHVSCPEALITQLLQYDAIRPVVW